MNTLKATALYCRISQADDRIESNSIETQKAILTRFAREHGFSNVRIFTDDGYTGTNFNRPAFQAMLRGIEAGEIGTVIVKDRSRLGRNFLETGRYTRVVFPEHGVRFLAVNNPVSEEDDACDIAAFMDIFNSWYPRDVSRKVKAVLKSKSRSGKPVGPNCPYGYVKDKLDKDKWLIDQNAAKNVKRIFQLYLSGNGVAHIATILKAKRILCPSAYRMKQNGACCGKHSPDPCGWSEKTVSNILKNESYTGITINFKTKRVSLNSKMRVPTTEDEQEILYKNHEAIIEDDTFKQAQELRKERNALITMLRNG